MIHTFLQQSIRTLIAISLSFYLIAAPLPAHAGLPVVDYTLISKEYALDTIALIIAKSAASAITQSIVTWINSGFEGNPAFVTDLEGFMLNVADEAAAEYISYLGDETQALLCTPFTPDIQIALTIDYAKTSSKHSAPRCSLDEVFANVERLENFIDGSFDEGGLDGFFNVAVNQQNNPYGSYLHAKSEMAIRLSDQLSVEANVIDWGAGFLSKKDCQPKQSGNIVDLANRFPGRDLVEEGDQWCAIVTPGKTIENELANVLGSGIRQLELADELGEIVTALMAQLAQQVITGARGLLGTNQANSSSGRSYFDEARLQQTTRTQGTLTSGINSTISSSISTEEDYRDLHQSTLTVAGEANSLLQNLEACLQAHSPSNPLLANTFAFVTGARQTINAAMTSATSEISAANTSLAILHDFEDQMVGTTATAELEAIFDDLTLHLNSGITHREADLSRAEPRQEAAQAELEEIIADIPGHRALCGS